MPTNRNAATRYQALDKCFIDYLHQTFLERLQVVKKQAIGVDIDDGVVVNYAKYCDVLKKTSNN